MSQVLEKLRRSFVDLGKPSSYYDDLKKLYVGDAQFLYMNMYVLALAYIVEKDPKKSWDAIEEQLPKDIDERTNMVLSIYSYRRNLKSKEYAELGE